MAIFCPKFNRKVIYLTCQECEDKICKKTKINEEKGENLKCLTTKEEKKKD
jgi:hypothetical protein